MKKIILNEKGEPIDELAERNEEIKSNLAPVLGDFLAEKEKMENLKKPIKLGYRFSKQLYLELAKYPPMSVEDFAELDYDTLYDIWLKYMELTAYYNRFFEIVDNKQLFCAFAGINSRQYSKLEKSEDDYIRDLMNTINSAFIGLGFVAGESGNADVKAVNNRLRAGGEAGHNVISAVEEKVIEKNEGKSQGEIIARLEQLGIKYIE